jgi:hypothetical protein
LPDVRVVTLFSVTGTFAKQLIRQPTVSKTKVYVESPAAFDMWKHPPGRPVTGDRCALSNPNISERTRSKTISVKPVWWLLSPDAALSHRCLSGLRWIYVDRPDAAIHVLI